MGDPYEQYLLQIEEAESLEEVDSIMFDCADDPVIGTSDFVKLTTYAKHIITSRGWIA